MKFVTIILASVFAALSIAKPVHYPAVAEYPSRDSFGMKDVARAVDKPAPSKKLHRIDLPAPTDWVAGPSLYPGNFIAGFEADLNKYNVTTWTAHIKKKCKGYKGCTSCNLFSANNTDVAQPGGRFWYGYLFRGGATKIANYTRAAGRNSNVQNSRAFTV